MKTKGKRSGCFFPFVGSALFALVVLASARPIRAFDPWWHLATGKWIFFHHAIPKVDPFSFTRAGKPWIDLAWFFQIVEFGVYKVAGFYGLVALKIIISLMVFYFLYKLLTLFISDLFLVFGLLFLVLGVVQGRFMVRPHLLAFLWLVIFLYSFYLFLIRGKLWRLAVLVVVYILWVNTHGSFVLGPFLVGSFLLGALAQRWNWQVKDIWEDSEIRRIGLVLFLVAFSSLCNPYGLKYVTFALFSHRGIGAQATKYIAEWHKMNPYSLFVLSPFSRIGLLSFLVWGALLLLCINIYKKKRGVVSHVLIFLLALYLSLKYVRFAALTSLLLVPSIACLYSWSREDFTTGFRNVFSFLIFVFPLVFLVFRLLPARINDPEMGRAVSRSYPHGVVKFIKEKGISGNMFNKYGYGGFLIWNLYPQCRVFIDGRTPTVYPADFYWLYRMVYKDDKLFKDLANEYNIGMVIESTDSTISKYLDKDKDWKLVFFDEVTTLFVENHVAQNKKIKTIKYYKPWLDIGNLIKKYQKNKKALASMKNELESVLSIYGTDLKATTDLGVLLSEGLKDYDTSLEVLKKAVNLDPKSPNVWYNLGLVYKKIGKYNQAGISFKKAISLKKNFTPALYQLGMLSFKTRKFKDALKFLGRYSSIVRDGTPPEVYEKIGLSYFNLLEMKEAVRNLKKAYYITHDNQKKSKICVNIGNCYFVKGDYSMAEKYYLIAQKLDTKNKEAYYNLSKVYERLGEKKKSDNYLKLYKNMAGE